MIFNIEQISNELYSANFDIKTTSNKIGSISLSGKMGSIDALIQGKFKDYAFELFRGHKKTFTTKRMLRPYIVSEEKIVDGMIYQTKYNGGLFKKFDFHQLILNEKVYDLFPISFGEKGSKSPIYNESKQIAQIDKDCVVYDDMHNYQIYALDDETAYIAVIFVSYMYIIAAYKPGIKIKKSIVKTTSIDNNQLLIEKYNPSFIEKIIE